MGPGERVGEYVLEQPLGAGGMKAVWRAVDVRDGRAVAVAVVHRFAPALFRNEVALARRVDSPHVARVIDGFVTPGGDGVVVSELCEGLDLARWRQANEPAVGDALAIGLGVARGLCAIHAAHVLHRDVKPANAILTRAGVKVIDFGISLPAIDERTGVGDAAPAAGTLPYMAPEVLGGEVDARSDAYSLGVTLYELITGALPLRAHSAHAHVQWLLARRPLPMEALDERGVDARAAALVARLCEPEAARRPYVADVVGELAALVEALGGRVPDPGVTERAPPPRFGMPYDGAPAAGPLGGTVEPAGVRPAPTFFPIQPPVRRTVPVALPDPARVVIGWPHLPLLALAPDGGGTQVRGYDADGVARWYVGVAAELRGGLCADLDGDGVGELYVWSDARLWAIDAAGRVRFTADVPPRRGPMPWDVGTLAPLVLERRSPAEGRLLAVGDVALDALDAIALPPGWQGQGDALIAADGVTGLSAHGAAHQRFRGDVGTAAAILTAPRRPGFVVAALERVFDGHPTVRLGLWGPGGVRVGGGDVGRYALETAPPAMYDRAQRADHPLFPAHVAPLAICGGGAPADDVVIVPFLTNAAWFGPALVAFDGTGRERWRERLPPLAGPPPVAPLLADLDGTGHPQLLWSTADGTLHRRDARTGAPSAPPAARGAPIAALDLGGRGSLQLLLWTPDSLELVPCGPCLPGTLAWLPTRADLWRSGTLGPDGLPIGPRL